MGLSRDGNSDVNMFKDINIEDALAMENRCLVDVRSPAEYKEATIPGQLTSFSPMGNAVFWEQFIGKRGRQRQNGWFGDGFPRLAELVGSIISSCQGKTPIIFCWRGGMRSRALTAILPHWIWMSTDQGGYKAFRLNLVLRNLPPTGCKPKC